MLYLTVAVPVAAAIVSASASSAFATQNTTTRTRQAPEAGVCDVSSATYPSIQSAVNDASCQTIQLVSSPTESVTIDRNLTISGVDTAGTSLVNGVSGTPAFTILAGTTVTFEDFQIAGGDANVDQGGGILNRGTLVLEGVEVVIGNATDGAGIYNAGALTLSGSQVSNSNATGTGGGIYNAGTLTLVGSSVFDNTANVDGGGIYNAGVLYRCGGAEVYDNEAPAGTDNDISGTPPQACPTAPDPEGPEQEEPDLVPTGGPSDVLLGTAIVVLLAGALALLAGRRRTA